ncbi:MAG: hypothetical protein A2Z04_09680 [Chloroflexi bacterium RBG_16_57_9]|nr:MAG: hypothetical protein A2Z04_09680 [Chloroflexi bacterium RBG_16_57_9]
MSEPRVDYDSPWKEALDHYFQEFLAFFFPHAYIEIDWTAGYEFLDKELQEVVRDAELGRRLVDKLVQVYRRSGDQTWVLVHVEMQGQEDPDFAKRMYTYNYRLFDRYDRWVVSLAVLGDEQANWRPAGYGYELWDCQVSIKFPAVKLLDYEARWEELEGSRNPFAALVMAHLKAQTTRRNPEERLLWKWRVVRGLYTRGFHKQDILELVRFIDWLMVLPDELARSFKATLREYEEEHKMPYVSSIERLAIEEGLQQGLQQGRLQEAQEELLYILETRFERAHDSMITEINRINDLSTLRKLLKQAVMLGSLEEFEQAMAESK